MIPKFKAWDKMEKQMVEINSIDFQLGTVGFWFTHNGKRYFKCRSLKDVILLLSTTIHDKNKKEIFEGDVVHEAFIERFGSYNIPEDCIGREKYRVDYDGPVIFKDAGFLIHTEKDGDCPLTQEADELEIIGNIYENPELLQ